jgi:phage-related baseplate assembly protein
MTRFTATTIDLSQLPAPDVIEALDEETVIAALSDDMVARYPPIAGVIQLESEPSRKLIEVFAGGDVQLRARINDAARAVMLAFAVGDDLEHLGSFFGVTRMEGETDARLRRRIQLAPEAYATTGSQGSYIYHALSADPGILDATAMRSRPGYVDVYIIGNQPDPAPTAAQLTAVRERLADTSIKPLTDVVRVYPARVVNTTVAAKMVLYPGPDSALVRSAALTALDRQLTANRRIGVDLMRSSIISRLHQDGVHSIILSSPETDIILDGTQVAHVTAVDVTVTGRDE